MRVSFRQAVALVIGLTSLSIAAATVLLLATQDALLDDLGVESVLDSAVATVAALAAALSGAAIIWHKAGNWVGWGLLLGFPALFSTFGGLYAGFAYVNDLPLALPIAMLAAAVYLPSIVGFVIIFTTFPNDRPQTWLGKTLIGVAALAATVPFIQEFFIPGTVWNLRAFGVVNPLGIESFDLPTWDSAYRIIVTMILLAALGLIGRAVRSRGVARQQFKWLTLVTVVAVLTKQTGSLVGLPSGVGEMALALIPVAVLVAITRYRLYDVDRIINRTLVYSFLTIVLATFFVALVVIPQTLFVGTETRSVAAVLLVASATVGVAAAFNPLRLRVQRIVDRRFSRTRYDAQVVVSDFRSRLQSPSDLPNLIEDVTDVVSRTLEPAQIGMWTRRPT